MHSKAPTWPSSGSCSSGPAIESLRSLRSGLSNGSHLSLGTPCARCSRGSDGSGTSVRSGRSLGSGSSREAWLSLRAIASSRTSPALVTSRT
jgi:hypothetical protein